MVFRLGVAQISDTWFTSDLHLSHPGILTYEPEARPFATVEEMNEAIIDRWNAVVGKHDKVYVLGDFCFGRKNIELAGRLKGQKRLILGNHDRYPMVEYLKYFKSCHGVLFWQNCILTHVPVHPQHTRGMLNVHGHTHSSNVKNLDYKKNDIPILPGEWRVVQYEDDSMYYNVSVEQNNLTPIHADKIMERLRELDL